jgi:hypothetical protein
MTNLYKFVYAFVVMFFAMTISAYSAEIVMIDDSSIYIRGEIVSGDGAAFTTLLEKNPKTKYVAINTTGGLVEDAMSMAYLIYEKKLITVIPENAECYSMCPIIFLSGYEKVMMANQTLGFHPSYTMKPNGERVLHPETSGQLSWWLGVLNVPLEIVWTMMGTSPYNLTAYTGEELNTLGVDIVLIE